MAEQKFVVAADVITAMCRELEYSRSHVARLLRVNQRRLKATFDGKWMIPRSSVATLRRIVERQSGPRYRLGERGPNRA